MSLRKRKREGRKEIEGREEGKKFKSVSSIIYSIANLSSYLMLT